ncbi:hypothetical protein JTB14_000139 [Gonioctena quinquepunctata]|nr:hypothetical protein JTB14_000139 [Gonioctena quinquepunctata]
MADMTESKVFLNDPNFISALPMETTDPENMLNPETDSLTPAQEMMIDQLLSESNENLENQKDISKDDMYANTNEEQHVESPTTRETFTFKCVFCDRVLSAADNPKLLECLHNSCSGCIDSRLYEHNEGMQEVAPDDQMMLSRHLLVVGVTLVASEIVNSVPKLVKSCKNSVQSLFSFLNVSMLKSPAMKNI